MEYMYKVYVRTDDAGRIIAINSSAFLADVTGWQEVDQGEGDRYHHAQGNYLPKPLTDDRGIYQYKLYKGKVTERTQKEKDADYVEPVDLVAEVEALKQENAYLKEAMELILSGATEE